MRILSMLCGLALLAVANLAQAVRITPAHSGTWYDPAFDKQGFVLEVLGKSDNGPERIATLQWYTYDDAGMPVWAVGAGVTEGNVLRVTLQQAFGGARPPEVVEASELVDFADVVLTFGQCHRGTADFTMSSDGSEGSYALVRLTQIGATTCTGGLADEVEPGSDPVTLVRQMASTGLVAGAQGTLKFKLRSAEAELEVDTRFLPVGDYSLWVGGEDKGTFAVEHASSNGNGVTKGTILFRAPAGEGELLLDFDPRGQLIEVVDANGATALSLTLDGIPDTP